MINAVGLFVCALTLAQSPAQSPKTFRSTVSIEIAADEAFKSTLESFINREIRELHDVEIVDKGGEDTIQIIALKATLEGGTATGYAVSVLVTTPLGPSMVNYLASLVAQPQQEFVRTVLQTQTDIRSYKILTVGRDGLKDLSERVVAVFDTDVIEPRRKIWRQLTKLAGGEPVR